MHKLTTKSALLRLLVSRRFSISTIAILALTVLGLQNKIDTSLAIASTAAALAGSAAYQKREPTIPPSEKTNEQ